MPGGLPGHREDPAPHTEDMATWPIKARPMVSSRGLLLVHRVRARRAWPVVHPRERVDFDLLALGDREHVGFPPTCPAWGEVGSGGSLLAMTKNLPDRGYIG